MSPRVAFFVMLIETALISAVLLLYPRIVRKGLLFGVYVGERTHESEAAQGITRSWYRGMVASLAASLLLGTTLARLGAEAPAAVAPTLLLVAGFFVFYLRAYRQARALVPAGPPPPAAAPLVATPPVDPLLPLLTVTAGLACGASALVYSWTHFAELPARIPTHFGISGEPDAWSPKSLGSVMTLPAMTLVLGVGLGSLAWLTANAKRAFRRSPGALSLVAQLRFRAAMTRFLCGVALITIGMLTHLSINAVRVGLGRASGLGTVPIALSGFLLLYAIGGTVYLALRYGQGGSRLEAAEADAPLTDGLADNRNWVLGMFYVNRDDPSFLIESRFGLGYTVNLGNPKALAVLALFLAALVALTIVAVASSS